MERDNQIALAARVGAGEDRVGQRHAAQFQRIVALASEPARVNTFIELGINRIVAVTVHRSRRIAIGVGPLAPHHAVVARAAIQKVDASAALQGVVVGAAVECVRSAQSLQIIHASATGNAVSAAVKICSTRCTNLIPSCDRVIAHRGTARQNFGLKLFTGYRFFRRAIPVQVKGEG